MKISVLITVAFIAFGCGRKITSNNESTDGKNPNLQSVNWKKLKGIDPVYLESINKPYTGKAFTLYPNIVEGSNNNKMVEFTFRNGVQDGLTVKWHRNGQKWTEENFKDGIVVEGSAKYWNSFGEPVDNLEDSLSVIGIHTAAEEGNIELVKKHLESGTDVNGMHVRKPPLYFAVRNDHTEVAKLLISKGAILNTEQPEIFNALYSAAGGNAGKETIELLITNGADLNFIRERGGNKGNETPLDRATRKGRTEIAELLRTHGAKTSKQLKAEAK
jgi:hypothetical protein